VRDGGPAPDAASRREVRTFAALASLAVFILLMAAIWLQDLRRHGIRRSR
jgi:hypothetical protein